MSCNIAAFSTRTNNKKESKFWFVKIEKATYLQLRQGIQRFKLLAFERPLRRFSVGRGKSALSIAKNAFSRDVNFCNEMLSSWRKLAMDKETRAGQEICNGRYCLHSCKANFFRKSEEMTDISNPQLLNFTLGLGILGITFVQNHHQALDGPDPGFSEKEGLDFGTIKLLTSL
jgi:hypothetical protein